MTLLAIVYLAASSVLTIHTVFQFWLYLATRRRRQRSAVTCNRDLPAVTVQLPIYNERFVARRILDAAVALDYPRELLSIQVLDDSTDDTTEIIAAHCAQLRHAGIAIEHIRRGTRTGFKAGALQHGLGRTAAELIAVFDADFVPAPDFLRVTVPQFDDALVSAVQARWGHMNRDESLLTRMQAFYIDVHFAIEQTGRAALGCFVNFNGTAGVWRASAIRDAGGWAADTLTEDLDLSYRTQLGGRRIVFLADVAVPAELPADVRAFRSQQYRWMKGVAQNARKLAPSVLRSSLPLRVKAHALAHLFESSNFVALCLVVALTPLAARTLPWWATLNPLWLANAAFLAPVYFAPRRDIARGVRGFVGGLLLWLVFLAVSLGMSLHNTVAVIEGAVRRAGTFVRTPKRGEGPTIARGPYHIAGLDRIVLVEVIFWCYLGGALVWSIWSGVLYLLWIPALGFVGLTGLLLGSVAQSRLQMADHPST